MTEQLCPSQGEHSTTRLALHPDGTPMISIGPAVDLSKPSPALDPEHSRQCMAEPPPAAGEVVAWLLEKAVQAADADQPKAAGMLTWAAQVIGEQSDSLERQQPQLVPAAGAEALAVRPMMEQIAAMGDCIGQQTVGQIMAISQRAAAWLRENPPGQPVAIEPRGCPTPGACSCVVPAPPAAGEVAELVAALRIKGSFTFPNYAQLSRTAELLECQYPQPVPVGERLPGPEDCDEMGRCWWYEDTEDCCGVWSLDIFDHEYTHWISAHALPLPS